MLEASADAYRTALDKKANGTVMKSPKPIARNNPASENAWSPKIAAPPQHVTAIGDGKVRTKRARGQQADAVFGAGREDMSAEYVARSLARIVRKGVRSATVREVAGVPVIFSTEIPVCTFALRTADRITAYRSGVPYVEVFCEATGIVSVA